MALAAVDNALGPALTLVPIDALRVVVGALLLVRTAGLCEAILRASGQTALTDEDAIYERELAGSRLDGAGTRSSMDWYAFKGVGFACMQSP